ncbi:MAG: glycerate kinase [Actinomycetota bacterium]
MRVLIVPDKFKGTSSARAVAQAMAEGVRSAAPEAEIEVRPMADGGDGTIEALLAAAGGHTEDFEVTGPLGEPVRAPVAFLDDGRCCVEMALASGLVLVEEGSRDALAATCRGTGELIRSAVRGGARGSEILVGIGGSASTDGGTGAAAAVGWRFLDARGRALPPGGRALRHLARIDDGGVVPELRGRSIIGVSDVDNPLLGPRGAARVFAPQKGAGPEQVEALEEGLANLAARIREDLGRDVAQLEGAGACGGIGAGLVAFFGARLGPGFETIAELTGLASRIQSADLVLTGEGRLDAQTLGGKVPAGVARVAADAGVPCAAVAGELDLDGEALRDAGFTAAVGLVDAVGRERAFRDTSDAVAEVTRRLVSAE